MSYATTPPSPPPLATQSHPARRHLVALVIGCLLILPGLGLLLGGAGVAGTYAFGRDSAGYLSLTLPTLSTPTPAITVENIIVETGPDVPSWLFDRLDLDVRMTARSQTAVASTIGIRAGFLLPLALVMLGIGLVMTGLAVMLIIRGASSDGQDVPPPDGVAVTAAAPAGAPVAGAPVAGAPFVGAPPAAATTEPDAWRPHPRAVSPVALDARLDQPLSRWLWLVKWILAIPHFIVLWCLWVAFFVVTFVAFFAILFTGSYPRSLFDFNLGVLRWSWRVGYYCSNGGLGTDRYPPFSLDAEPDYPARLDIAYPTQLSRGLVLVKWWLLAIPHYLILGLLVGGGWGWTSTRSDGLRFDPIGGGLLGLLVVIAGILLLFTDRYPRSLFDLVIGLNRWIYRVIAYVTLMSDVYPPFQLDEGGPEVPLAPPPPMPPPMTPPLQPAVPDDRVPAPPERVG
jgi:hypothetical protein